MSSMVSGEILKPYAQALMDLAQAQDLTDRFGQDADLVIETLEASQELSQFLSNPLVNPTPKKGALRQLFGEQVHPFMFNFLMLLVDRGRILFVEGICAQYKSLLRELNQTVLAEVTSVIELSDEQQASIRQEVMTMTSAREVELSISLDSDLIGGVVIKVGSQVIDASLRGQLRRIGLSLASAT